MKILYYDWSVNRGLCVLFGDAEHPTFFNGFAELFNSLSEPHILVGESTFESYDPEHKAWVINTCARVGHKLLCVKPKLTPRYRARLDLPKNDENDVIAIRLMYKSGVHFQSPEIFDVNSPFAREQVAMMNEIMEMRRDQVRVPGKRKPVSKKILFAKSIKDALPKKLAKEYSLCQIAAVGIAAIHSKNRKEFEKISGLHGNGYGSQVRSDLMFHGWKNAEKRGVKISAWRNGVRDLYHAVKKVIG